MKRTLILGATPNPTRVAYTAAQHLNKEKHPIALVGIKKGEVAGYKIINDKRILEGIDTITLYIGARHQQEWYDYIVATQPKRIIFNPGTENTELEELARENGIHVERACTLVLLSVGLY